MFLSRGVEMYPPPLWLCFKLQTGHQLFASLETTGHSCPSLFGTKIPWYLSEGGRGRPHWVQAKKQLTVSLNVWRPVVCILDAHPSSWSVALDFLLISQDTEIGKFIGEPFHHEMQHICLFVKDLTKYVSIMCSLPCLAIATLCPPQFESGTATNIWVHKTAFVPRQLLGRRACRGSPKQACTCHASRCSTVGHRAWTHFS